MRSQTSGRLLQRARAPSQRGSSLIVIIALVVGLIILAAMNAGSNVASERASANSRDGDLAFQAAEFALRKAESTLSALSGPSDGNASCSANRAVLGVCYLGGNNYRLSAAGFTGLSLTQATHCPGAVGCPAGRLSILDATPAVTANTGNPALSRQPAYLIEVLPSMVAGEESQNVTWMYRITAKGWGASANTQKVVQSVYYRGAP